MSFFSFLGTSKQHYSNAEGFFSKAVESVSNIFETLSSGLSKIDTQTVKNTAFAAAAGFHSYEYIAGKIISTNAALNVAKYITGNAQVGMLAKATEYTAMKLITSPITCMNALTATSILAANYEHIIPVVKGLASISWETAKGAFYATGSVIEQSVGSVLYTAESVEDFLFPAEPEVESRLFIGDQDITAFEVA